MESISPEQARAHIASAQQAADAATSAALFMPPLWFWPLFGLLGPGIFGYRLAQQTTSLSAAQANMLLLASIGFVAAAAIATAVVGYYQWSQSTVRLRAPIRGGPRPSKWQHLSFFFVYSGMIAAFNLGTDSNAVVKALIVYLWLTVGLWWVWHRITRNRRSR